MRLPRFHGAEVGLPRDDSCEYEVLLAYKFDAQPSLLWIRSLHVISSGLMGQKPSDKVKGLSRWTYTCDASETEFYAWAAIPLKV